MALVSERPRAARDVYAVALQPSGEPIELGGGWNLPSHHRKTGVAAAVDDQPLPAVVHTKGAHLAAAIDLLHAEQPRRHPAPLVELRRVDPDIAERGDFHRIPPKGIASAALRRA